MTTIENAQTPSLASSIPQQQQQQQRNLIAWLDNVTKSYGSIVAVSQICFAIPQGSFMGFLGPNGAGKSTSIRLLLGLIRPQIGQIRVFNKDPFIDPAVKQKIGYVPESDPFPRWITAQEFLTKFGSFQLTRSDAKRRALEILEEMGLSEVKNKRIWQFSKGMKQRIKFAQAIMHKPALVIADEPFNGLDPVIRKQIFDLIQYYRTEYGSTFFVSSHVLYEVDRLADQIVLLHNGRTIAQGSPLRIRAMIQEVPHSIQIVTRSNKLLATMLINNGDPEIISSMQFQPDPRSQQNQLIVLTKQPVMFYRLLTDLIVDNNIVVNELKATDEGLENLFRVLTG